MKEYYRKQRLVNNIRNYPLHVFFVGLLAVIVAAALTFGYILPHRASGQSLKADGTVIDSSGSGQSLNPRAALVSFADIVEKVSPSVVTIRSDTKAKPIGQNMSPSKFESFLRI